MNWIFPKYSKSRVNEAGRALAHRDGLSRDYAEDYEVINNWRSAHSLPLNALHKGLERLAGQWFPGTIVARRLKRTPAMIGKLLREPTMKLSTMQDIGGCRAVVETIGEVADFADRFKMNRRAHILKKEYNYIGSPKPSGYRGVHLIYSYRNATGRKEALSGFSVEVQVRTKLQHAWATAVETVGTFLHQSLKSSMGSQEWLRFFSLVGSGFALLEGTATVPGTPADHQELVREIRAICRDLDVRAKLDAFGKTIRIQENVLTEKHKYFVLSYDSNADMLSIAAFEESQFREATEYYRVTEEKNTERTDIDIMLCSVQSLSQLKRAYPNYYMDSAAFLSALNRLTDD